MAIVAPTTFSDCSLDIGPRPLGQRIAGTLLIVAGLLLIVITQWSISTLADDLALEIDAPDSLQVVGRETANLPIGSGPLATARMRVTWDVDEPIRELRTHLRNAGFTLAGAEPEEWFRPRSDGYDGTILTLDPPVQKSGPRFIGIEVTTTDDDARLVFPIVALVSLWLVVGGAILATPEGGLASWRQRIFGATGALICTMLATIALRALSLARALINGHVTEHGPLPDQLHLLGANGNEAEQLLASQLGVVGGLYPFGVIAAAVPLILGAIGLLRLTGSRRSTTIMGLAAIAIVVVVWLYGPIGNTVVNILE